jgi:hypothetical protein
VPDTLNIKVPPGLRKRLEEAARRNALSIQGEAARRLQASFKRRPRKHRWLQEYDQIIDLLVLAAVLKKPKRKAHETIARLGTKEPFKRYGDLRSRHNRLKRALIERGKFATLEDGVRNHGRDLMARYGQTPVTLERARKVAEKRVAMFKAIEEIDGQYRLFMDWAAEQGDDEPGLAVRWLKQTQPSLDAMLAMLAAVEDDPLVAEDFGGVELSR